MGGKANEGLHWMLKSLELHADLSPDFRDLVATNLASWSRQVITLEAILPDDAQVMLTAFSPDSRWMATGNTDGQVNIWDRQSMQLKHALPRCEQNFVKALLFSPDSSSLFTVWGIDDTSRSPGGSSQWNVETGKRIRKFDESCGLNAAALSSNAALLATGDFLGNVRIWDTVDGKLLRTLKPGGRQFHGLDFAENGTEIVALAETGTGGQREGTMTRWDVKSGERLDEPIRRAGQFFTTTATPQGNSIVMFSSDSRIPVLDLETYTFDDSLYYSAEGAETGAFSPDGSLLAVAGLESSALSLFDSRSGTLLGHMHLGSRVRGPSLSSDGTWLLVGCRDSPAADAAHAASLQC